MSLALEALSLVLGGKLSPGHMHEGPLPSLGTCTRLPNMQTPQHRPDSHVRHRRLGQGGLSPSPRDVKEKETYSCWENPGSQTNARWEKARNLARPFVPQKLSSWFANHSSAYAH